MGPFLADLAHSWWSLELPGARPRGARYATYSASEWQRLPPAPSWVTRDYFWLSSSPVYEASSLAEPYEAARRDLAGWEDHADLTAGMRLPADFLNFVRAPTLRRHLRSATDCYFDLGDHPVQVTDGRLLHFLSDSQWIRHWLLFVADRGEQAVITTEFPAGFHLTTEDRGAYPGEPAFEICASTFLEFIWRLWIENDIWFALTRENQPPDPQPAGLRQPLQKHLTGPHQPHGC